jgi:thiamine-phosphate pyrophosphorylase
VNATVLPLPLLLVVTDGSSTQNRSLPEVVGEAISGGARAVLLRERQLCFEERASLAGELAALLRPVGGKLLVAAVASDPPIACDGIHFPSHAKAPSAGEHRLIGRSCHSAADVVRAAEDGMQYVTLSPIFATASKPGYGPALGPEALSGHPLPVWALGGIDPSNAAQCISAGATGVAVMGAIMRAEDPGAVTSALCDALAGARYPR